MQEWNDKDKKQYEEAIKALQGIHAEPSPYMKTRILANVREAEAQKQKAFPWLQLVFGSLAAAALAVVITFQVMPTSQGEVVALGKPYLVKADLRLLEEADLSYVKVELVGSVQFSSDKFEHIKEMRSLTLSWDKLVGKQYLPVVVKGVEKGESHVKIHFYNDAGEVVKTQDYQLDFTREAS